MKPLRLIVEGFTSFRERVEVDFSGLDLFAITGPTGSGKSSLIDAIVFALYGQVPRVGDDYKQLISHGAKRLSVLFEFRARGGRYRVARVASPARASQQRLERLGAGEEAEPLADKAREIRAEVERLLGLDYEGFTRAVVLPQGQFDAFLKGEPKDRRSILVSLLGLGVYERMLQLANQKGAAARAEADFLRRQIETDYLGATPEAVEEARARLCRADLEARAAEASLGRLAEALGLGRLVRAARVDLQTATEDEESEKRALASAEAALEQATLTNSALEAELSALPVLDRAEDDEARRRSLAEAAARAEQFAVLRPGCMRLTQELAIRRRAWQEAAAERVLAEAALSGAEGTLEEARAREGRVRSERDAAHRLHLAASLRSGLAAGERCPVCAQPVPAIHATAEAPDLEAADRALREAELASRKASEEVQQHKVRCVELRARVEGLGREAAQLEAQRAESHRHLDAVQSELADAGVLAIEMTDAAALVSRLRSELTALDAARARRVEADERRQTLEKRQAAQQASLAASRERCSQARERLAAVGGRRRSRAIELANARRDLLAEVEAEGWEGVAANAGGGDEVDALEALHAAGQRAASDAASRVATSKLTLQRIEGDVIRAVELRAKRDDLESRAALSKCLADHLKANELLAWIQEEALQRLAEDGSRHLATLSQGRYALRLGAGEGEDAARAEQEFYVVDHWSGESVRSVRTLSGGETFLASLALALALAESVAQLSSEGRASQALESLFLDEGFGNLDTETLDVVVSALDALHGGERTVGIVTHVRDLAERLPARLEVRRTGSTSAAVVV